MNSEKLSSTEDSYLKTNQTSIQEEVRRAYYRNIVITNLVSALHYHNVDVLVDEMPEDFIDQCTEYLSDLCYCNDLTLYRLLDSQENE